MPPFAPRKLLVAVIGAAAVNLACSKSPPTGGNLRAPEPEPSALPPTGGNLMAPEPAPSAVPPTAGNLMAPTATAPLEQVPPLRTVDASAPDAATRVPVPVRPKRPPTSGNLMSPDAPQPGPPTTGNMMPAPVKKP